MSDNVKDFAYYARAAERVIETIQDDWPTVDVVATAAIAQVFATLATGAPKPAPELVATSGPCYGKLTDPENPDLYYKCIRGQHTEGLHEAVNGAQFHD